MTASWGKGFGLGNGLGLVTGELDGLGEIDGEGFGLWDAEGEGEAHEQHGVGDILGDSEGLAEAVGEGDGEDTGGGVEVGVGDCAKAKKPTKSIHNPKSKAHLSI